MPPWHQPRRMARVLTGIDLAIPFLDTAYVLAWLPGLVLACFGFYWLVGPMTIAVIPLTVLAYAFLFRRQWRDVFKPLGLRVRKNVAGPRRLPLRVPDPHVGGVGARATRRSCSAAAEMEVRRHHPDS